VDEGERDPDENGVDELFCAHDSETNESRKPNKGRAEKWRIEWLD